MKKMLTLGTVIFFKKLTITLFLEKTANLMMFATLRGTNQGNFCSSPRAATHLQLLRLSCCGKRLCQE
jgi:hypothetical protein